MESGIENPGYRWHDGTRSRDGKSPLRLGIVDGHEAIRIGIAAAAQRDAAGSEWPVLVTRASATVGSLIAGGPRVCQVVVLDLRLGDGSDPALNVHQLREHGCNVVVYSEADHPGALRRAMLAGAVGHVRKDAPTARLLDAAREAVTGNMVPCRELAAVIEEDGRFVHTALTDKEREAVGLYASGLSIEATAASMGCAPATAKTFVDRARAKYQAANRPARQKVHLFINAIEDGILPPVIPGRG